MKIVVLDGYTLNPGDLNWDALRELGEVEVYDYTALADIAPRIKNANAVFTNKTELGETVLKSASELRYIGVLATGYNVVDINAATKQGIIVTNIPTYGTASVAQYVFALLLELCHHVGHHNTAVQSGRWTNGRDFCFWDYPLIELSGKTMGIIGYGRIGRATADIARAFGMQVLAYDAFGTDDTLVSLDALLAMSDVISLHCPLTPENAGMINEETIAKMKDGVMLINTSRGTLINEAALSAALKRGKVYAAAVDVVSYEPVRADNPLMGLDNCLITPHIAWAPRESRQRLLDTAVKNLSCFLADKPMNMVNRPDTV